MPIDVRQLLEHGAPPPLRDVDVDAVSARGRQWRRHRTAAGAATVVAVVALAVLPLPRLLSRSPTVVFDQPAGTSDEALAYGIDGDIYVAEADGTNPVRIADGDPDDGRNECEPGMVRTRYLGFGSVWSPDGRYLAYWDWRPCPVPEHGNEWGTVYISDPQGKVVASFPGQGWLISWHPDASRVAVWDSIGAWEAWLENGRTMVTGTVDRDSTIGVYGVDGERQAQLTVPAELLSAGDFSPVWSQDGTALLVADLQVPLNGDAPTKRDTSTSQVFSPDGSRAAYKDGKGSLVVAEADNPDDLKAMSGGEWPEAAWSPAGDRVAFTKERYSDTIDSNGLREVLSSQLRVRDLTTGTETTLTGTRGPGPLQVVEFSVDGERILFTKAEDENTAVRSLWSINADGSELRQLVSRVEWADWRPAAPQR